MIPSFPNFTNLDIKIQKEFIDYTNSFEPYSDFNFISLFSWNVDETSQISILNENLIIKMPDYLTGDPLYSILGVTKIDESVVELLNFTPQLKIVPEVVVRNLKNIKSVNMIEDRDQFDYIYPIPSQADLDGGKFRGKRKRISKFLNVYENRLNIKKIHFEDEKERVELQENFLNWAKSRGKLDEETIHESKALKRLLDNQTYFNLLGIKLFIDDICVAFSINELVQNDYAICHFQKAILTYEYIDIFLSNLVAKELKHYGCKYVNWEQDLGIPGLRQLKEAYLQEFFLKKYTITKI